MLQDCRQRGVTAQLSSKPYEIEADSIGANTYDPTT